jgi:DNA-binding HxlR family transcriptional regulator
MKRIEISPPPAARPKADRIVEDILGCKWTLSVLRLVRQGVVRPGAMERAVEGLTAKVLNERLRKLLRHDVIRRDAYAEIPPRVEYHLTPFGKKLVRILDAIEKLNR